MIAPQKAPRVSKAPLHYYTSEEIEFLKKTVKGKSYEEIYRLFNERFGLELNPGQIGGKIRNMGLGNGMDNRYGYGRKPNDHAFNSYQIGMELIFSDGYTYVKIYSWKDGDPLSKNSEKWRKKHLLIWEKAHGPIPQGHVIIFADGNKSNTDPDNLLLVSRSEQIIMNHYGLISSDPEITKTGLLVARLKLLASKRARKLKEKEVTI
jgi:hypothetical protein